MYIEIYSLSYFIMYIYICIYIYIIFLFAYYNKYIYLLSYIHDYIYIIKYITMYIISIYVYFIYTQYIPVNWAMAIQWYPCVATLLEFPNMKKTIVWAINSPQKCDQNNYISKFPYHLNPKPQHLSGFRRWNVWSCSEVTILPAFGPGVPGVPMIPSSYWGTPMTIKTP